MKYNKKKLKYQTILFLMIKNNDQKVSQIKHRNLGLNLVKMKKYLQVKTLKNQNLIMKIIVKIIVKKNKKNKKNKM